MTAYISPLANEITDAEAALAAAVGVRAQRATRAKLIGLLTVACVLRDGPTCRYCGIITLVYGPQHALRTVDHVVPVVRGGQDKLENLCVVCRSCNGRKGARPVRAFARAPQETTL